MFATGVKIKATGQLNLMTALLIIVTLVVHCLKHTLVNESAIHPGVR